MTGFRINLQAFMIDQNARNYHCPIRLKRKNINTPITNFILSLIRFLRLEGAWFLQILVRVKFWHIIWNKACRWLFTYWLYLVDLFIINQEIKQIKICVGRI